MFTCLFLHTLPKTVKDVCTDKDVRIYLHTHVGLRRPTGASDCCRPQVPVARLSHWTLQAQSHLASPCQSYPLQGSETGPESACRWPAYPERRSSPPGGSSRRASAAPPYGQAWTEPRMAGNRSGMESRSFLGWAAMAALAGWHVCLAQSQGRTALETSWQGEGEKESRQWGTDFFPVVRRSQAGGHGDSAALREETGGASLRERRDEQHCPDGAECSQPSPQAGLQGPASAKGVRRTETPVGCLCRRDETDTEEGEEPLHQRPECDRAGLARGPGGSVGSTPAAAALPGDKGPGTRHSRHHNGVRGMARHPSDLGCPSDSIWQCQPPTAYPGAAGGWGASRHSGAPATPPRRSTRPLPMTPPTSSKSSLPPQSSLGQVMPTMETALSKDPYMQSPSLAHFGMPLSPGSAATAPPGLAPSIKLTTTADTAEDTTVEDAPGAPSLSEKLSEKRRTALAPFGVESRRLHTAPPGQEQGLIEAPPPTTFLDDDGEEELDAASPGLGNLE